MGYTGTKNYNNKIFFYNNKIKNYNKKNGES